MVVNNIKIRNEGYVYCKSNFYSAHDCISSDSDYTFFTGINRLIGEIDSGIWAVSYLLSMYKYRSEDFILFEQPRAILNDEFILLNELSKFSCYMDKSYPLFSSKDSVKKLVLQGLNDSKIDCSLDEIRNLFHIDRERFERPLTSVGNEIFRAMAAIGYCYSKEIFCFPWLSNKRFKSYHGNLTDLLDILESLNKVVILPVGAETPELNNN